MLGKYGHVLLTKWLRAHVDWMSIRLPRPTHQSNVVGARPPLCVSLSPESLYVGSPGSPPRARFLCALVLL